MKSIKMFSLLIVLVAVFMWSCEKQEPTQKPNGEDTTVVDTIPTVDPDTPDVEPPVVPTTEFTLNITDPDTYAADADQFIAGLQVDTVFFPLDTVDYNNGVLVFTLPLEFEVEKMMNQAKFFDGINLAAEGLTVSGTEANFQNIKFAAVKDGVKTGKFITTNAPGGMYVFCDRDFSVVGSYTEDNGSQYIFQCEFNKGYNFFQLKPDFNMETFKMDYTYTTVVPENIKILVY